MLKFTRALITGASSGIGAEYARQLAQSETSLVLVARRQDRLSSLMEELKAQGCGQDIEVIAADLSTAKGIERVAQRIRSLPDLDLLVNNAGFGGRGKFMDDADSVAMDMINVHVLASTTLIRAALPAMQTRKSGAIINVSSIAAFFPIPGNTSYCATKAYLSYISESLQNEVRESGIFIQALCPGLTRSEFHARMKMDPTKFQNAPWMSSKQVVEISLRSLGSGRVVVVPGIPNQLLAFLMETYIIRQMMRWYFRIRYR